MLAMKGLPIAAVVAGLYVMQLSSAYAQVTAEIVKPKGPLVATDHLRLGVKVANNSGEDIVIQKIVLQCPDEIECSQRSQGSAREQLVSGEEAEVQVGASESSGYEFKLPRVPWRTLWRQESWLTFSARDYDFSAKITYGTGEAERTVTTAAEIPLRSSMWVLVVGAIVGAALVTFVDVLRRLRRAMAEGSKITAQRCLRRGILLLLDISLGTLLAAVAIFLADKTTTLDNVLQVRVLDIWGGFVIGLLVQAGTADVRAAVKQTVGL